jgi:hypothetical protein
MSDHYDFSGQDVQYRRDVTNAMGTGFDVPKTLTPNRSNASEKTPETVLIGRLAETVETEAIPC